jgi:hypothetical protein
MGGHLIAKHPGPFDQNIGPIILAFEAQGDNHNEWFNTTGGYLITNVTVCLVKHSDPSLKLGA